MNLFARIVEALHQSRRRQADDVIRFYSHLVTEAHAHEHRRLQGAEIPAPASPMTLASVARCAP